MAARGELTLTVLEANGQRQDGQQLWDPNFVNGFVKGSVYDEVALRPTCRCKYSNVVSLCSRNTRRSSDSQGG